MQGVLFEITPEKNQKQYLEESDTDFAYALPGEARFRCNLLQERLGPAAVFRLIPEEILTADQLNLPPAIRNLCYLSKGLVLVTGPTGSGKSTTLAAMVDMINKTRSDHIITIEDPIEFVQPSKKCLVHQREVGNHTQSFKRALRAALREDPDIILVGEMRDLETIEIAIETAETGHLVFGTLHTTTAASTVDRIIDQFPADRQSQIRTLLASSLRGVVAQTLLKKKSGGRVAALEVLIGTPAVAALVREGKTHQLTSQMQMGAKNGMRLLNDSLMEHVSSGAVDPLEAYVKAVNKTELCTMFEHAGIAFEPPGANSGPPATPAPAAAVSAPVQVAQQDSAPAEPAAPLPTDPPSQMADPMGDFESFRKNRG
jgi:twitching motility protein PilT